MYKHLRNAINHLKKYLFLPLLSFPKSSLFITFWFLVDKFLSLSGVATATLAPTGRSPMFIGDTYIFSLVWHYGRGLFTGGKYTFPQRAENGIVAEKMDNYF